MNKTDMYCCLLGHPKELHTNFAYYEQPPPVLNYFFIEMGFRFQLHERVGGLCVIKEIHFSSYRHMIGS